MESTDKAPLKINDIKRSVTIEIDAIRFGYTESK